MTKIDIIGAVVVGLLFALMFAWGIAPGVPLFQ